MNKTIYELEELFASLPGIGPRMAQRCVHYLLGKSKNDLIKIAELLVDAHKNVKRCVRCARLHETKDAVQDTCYICSDPGRDTTTLMVVAHDADVEHLEKVGLYKGLYYVVGGTVPLFDKSPETRIRLRELLKNVENASYKEIIIAFGVTPEGDYTMGLIHESLRTLAENRKTTISCLGRGLSTGTELEYSDKETLRNALLKRG